MTTASSVVCVRECSVGAEGLNELYPVPRVNRKKFPLSLCRHEVMKNRWDNNFNTFSVINECFNNGHA